jgi:DNA-binding transcriptional MocR family regulator
VTPEEEATFITLWQQQASYQQLAAALGIPAGTVSSRAATLQRQGKITPRPRGGAYPRQRGQAKHDDTPAPPATPAPLAPERKEIQQWTVLLSKALIEHIKAVAYERRIPPSQLLEEWCWQQAHHEKE